MNTASFHPDTLSRQQMLDELLAQEDDQRNTAPVETCQQTEVSSNRKTLRHPANLRDRDQ
jgi:hypothetical protein